MFNIKKLILIITFIATLTLFLIFDVYSFLGLDRIQELIDGIRSFGIIGPIIYILLYWIACLFFVPGIAISALGAIVYGPVIGTVLISIGSTTGATLCFLFSRYVGREYIVSKFGENKFYTKIDKGVKEQGVRMLMITRLVPLFPFNLQNYLYGLTDINVFVYMFVSWICMLPATIAYAFLAGAIIDGEGDVGKTLLYFAVGGVFLVIVSFIPKWINKRDLAKKI